MPTRTTANARRPDLDLLRMALLEQEGNTMAGRQPSSNAMNAYLGEIPETFEQGREADMLGEMDRRYYADREDDRKRRGALEDAKAKASIRNFETRRGVREASAESGPLAFTPENFRPMASHGPTPESPTRQITRAPLTPNAFTGDAATDTDPSVRTIRRFTTGRDFTDPDAAMSAADKARLDPRVMAADIDAKAATAKATPTGPSPYGRERGIRNMQSINELTDRVNLWTTGAGSALSVIPGTDARDFNAELDTLKANIAFGELTAMREASKTGGALGSVAVRELDLLESPLGALDSGQSPDNLKRQLAKIQDSLVRWDGELAKYKPGGGAPRRVGRFEIEEN